MQLTWGLLDPNFTIWVVGCGGRLPFVAKTSSANTLTLCSQNLTETCTLQTDSPGFLLLCFVNWTSAYTTLAWAIVRPCLNTLWRLASHQARNTSCRCLSCGPDTTRPERTDQFLMECTKIIFQLCSILSPWTSPPLDLHRHWNQAAVTSSALHVLHTCANAKQNRSNKISPSFSSWHGHASFQSCWLLLTTPMFLMTVFLRFMADLSMLLNNKQCFIILI